MRTSETALNILQVIPDLDAGGAERTAIDVAKAVIDAGGRAVIASQGGRLAEECENAGGKLERLPLASKNPLTIWNNIRPLCRVITAHDIDVIHARSRAPAWSAFYAAKQTRIPYIATYHGTYSSPNAWKRKYNAIMIRGPKVIANSEFIATHIQNEHHLPKDHIVTIPRGSDFSTLNPETVSPQACEELRAAWGLAGDTRPIIFLPGRLTRWKGQSVLIEAAATLRRQGNNTFVCIFAGDAQGRDGYEDELRTLINTNGLENHVRIVGHCANMPAAYSLATVVLSTSTRPEAFGRIAVEGQAMAKPVIVSDHGGSRETVLDGETGWRVPPADSQSLTSSLAAVLRMTPQQREEIGTKGRNHVLKAYSVNQMCAKTMAVYHNVVATYRGET